MKNQFAIAVTLLIFSLLTFNANADDRLVIEHGLQMAQIDYKSAHPVLLGLCKAKFPESVPSLTQGISTWEAENQESQHYLQLFMRKKSGLSDQELDSQFQKFTNGFKYSLEHLPDSELQQWCTSYVSVTLKLQEMNFHELLNKIQVRQ